MGVTFTKARAFPCRIETPFSSAEGHLFSPCKKELFEHPVNWSPVGMSSAAFWDSEIANYWDELHSWHTQKNDKHIVPNAARKYLKVTFSTIRFRCRNTLKWVWWVAVEVFLEGGYVLILPALQIKSSHSRTSGGVGDLQSSVIWFWIIS